MPDFYNVFKFKERALGLEKPVVMGILNVTPDSFSDGGECASLPAALRRAEKMIADGAAIIDVGGESTRPDFTPVDEAEEKRRIIPVIKELRAMFPECIISADTMKASVAEATLEAGADMINDVSGCSDSRILEVVREWGAGFVIMHGYTAHVGGERPANIKDFGPWVINGLIVQLENVLARGIEEERVCIDPGFGFGKKHAENREVLLAIPEIISACDRPVLAGASRKHFVNGLYPGEGGNTTNASVRLALDAYRLGAKIFRVHDVLDTCIALNNALK
jgi:dihydropteroate synthase